MVAKKRKLAKPFVKILAAALILLLGFLFLRLNTHYWNGKDRITSVAQKENGDTEVVLTDPKLDEVITLIIPGDTEVTVARNLGTMRLKNVWQLGENESVGGSLVAQTVTRNFLFPVFLWTDLGGETNIPIGDRLFLKIFDLTTKNLDRTKINLGESQFIKRGVISDGELGYKLYGEISDRLTAYFVDENFEGKKVYIKDATGEFGIAENVGKILEVMGGKVITIEKLSKEALGCQVSGKDREMISKISTLFSCKKSAGEVDTDLEIRLGSDFLF